MVKPLFALLYLSHVVDGIEELVDTCTASIEITKPDILVGAKRVELRNLMSNILKDATFIDMVDNDSPAY